jgi:hypothetical protein
VTDGVVQSQLARLTRPQECYLNGMYTFVRIYCAICCIFACDVYLPDLPISGTLGLQPDLGKQSRPSPAKGVRSPRNHPHQCD